MALDTETLTLLLDAVRRFVHERLIPAEDELAASGQVPPDIVREMRELGLFGLSIAPEHGGLGLNMEEEVRVVFELGQTSPAFRSLAGTNIGIGSQAIVLAGTDEQRALPAQAGQRRADRLLRADRAGRRLRRHGAARLGRARWRPLRAQRHQALHHQRAHRRPVLGHGAHRARAPRRVDLLLPGRGGHARPVHRPARQENGSVRRADQRRGVRQLPRARQRAAGRRGRQRFPHLHAGAGQGPAAHLRAVRGHCRPSVA